MAAVVDDRVYPLQMLVDQCWGMLKGEQRVTFPTTTPAHPSRYVFMQPSRIQYPGAFWQGAIVPVMKDLLAHPPTYIDGWSNPMARNTVEAYLRRGLTGSPWSGWVDFSR